MKFLLGFWAGASYNKRREEYGKKEGEKYMKELKEVTREKLKAFRRALRNNPTSAEEELWSYLRNKQLDGRRFRRQHSKGNYILDFYCHREKLAVELDGESHCNTHKQEYDLQRDNFLCRVGIKVLRFENKIVFRNPTWLLGQIRAEFGKTCSRRDGMSLSPPPLRGTSRV